MKWYAFQTHISATMAGQSILSFCGQVQRLQRAIQEYENDRWRIIAGKVGNGFTPAACRERASQLENPQ